jgi:hypothetical protein
VLKAKAGDLVILGVTRENIERLVEGKPILVNLDELGIPGKSCVIMFGETPVDIITEIKKAGFDIPKDLSGTPTH